MQTLKVGKPSKTKRQKNWFWASEFVLKHRHDILVSYFTALKYRPFSVRVGPSVCVRPSLPSYVASTHPGFQHRATLKDLPKAAVLLLRSLSHGTQLGPQKGESSILMSPLFIYFRKEPNLCSLSLIVFHIPQGGFYFGRVAST